jgi:ubiquinone biosynthesis protein
VALSLDPDVNMWDVAAPYVRDWIRDELGPEAKAADGLVANIRLLRRLPELAQRFVRQLPPESAAPPTAPVPELEPQPVLGVVVERSSRWPWLVVGAVLGVVGTLLAGMV